MTGMAKLLFSGSILVEGVPHSVAVEGNPLGHTKIQVDGRTAYDKTPFVHTGEIGFEIFPGKKGLLKWERVSLREMECDIVVDGSMTTLAALAPSGNIKVPVSAQQRREFQIRASGASLVTTAVGCFLVNYFAIHDGTYYPKLLFMTPLFLVGGLTMVAKPDLDSTLQKAKTIGIGLGVVMLIVSWLFEKWFVITFAPQ
jgi:hypothetical protein